MEEHFVKHYIITNRQVYTHGGKEYIREDGKELATYDLRFGEMYFNPNVKVPEITGKNYHLYPDEPLEHSLAEKMSEQPMNLEEGLPYNITVQGAADFGSTKMFEQLNQIGRDHAPDTHHILFFIHGYKTDLQVAFETVRQLHKRYVENDTCPIQEIVLFTWPAMKQLLEYRDDAKDAIESGYALARAFRKLKRFFSNIAHKIDCGEDHAFCEQKIHLMCHSMGNRVLESMFEELNSQRIRINSIFGEIFLLAADIDYHAMEAPNALYNLIEAGERIHIYYHNKDKALGISEHTKNSFNRLGRWGAKNTLSLPDDVFQANVTGVQENYASLIDDWINHWYYLNSDAVVQDIIHVINGEDSLFDML